MKNVISKINAVMMSLLLFGISVSATVTLNDKELITDDSGFRLDFDDNWLRCYNATMENLSVANITVSGSSNFSGDVVEGQIASSPEVRIGHHGVWDHPVVFFDDGATDSWGIDLSAGADMLRFFIPTDVIMSLTPTQAIIDVPLDVTGDLVVSDNVSAMNISIDGMKMNGSYSEYDTMIRNSNGKYWEATATNIQTAIWDLNGTDGGTVWLPGNMTHIVRYSAISIEDKVILDLGGSKIYCGHDVNIFKLSGARSVIRNGLICSGEAFKSAAIWVTHNGNAGRRIEGIQFYGDTGLDQGTAIYFDATNTGDSVYGVIVSNVWIYGFSNSIFMETADNGWCNGNVIDNVWFDSYTYGINMSRGGSDYIACNYFTNVQFGTGTYSIRAAILEDYSNYFQGVVWDWDTAYNMDNSRVAFEVYGAKNNIDAYVSTSGTIDDQGTDTIFINRHNFTNSLFPYYAQANPPTLATNTTAYWYNTTGDWFYLIANTYGTQYYLNMSTTY